MKIRVIDEIDRGGFGRVDEVELPNGERAARKTLDPIYNLTSEVYQKVRKRFEREVNTQSALPSHIVLPILYAALDDEKPWYIMPLAEKNYWDQIEEDQDREIINIEPIADILNALEELHDLGYVHRDLKPENILFHEGRWKLSDFGLVMPTDEAISRFTSTNSLWGTKPYMAPEQYRRFRDVTHLADIYSVGCILHDLVSDSKRTPFQQISCEGPLAPIIEKATESDPNRRFQTVSKLRGALNTALYEPTVSSGLLSDEWVELLGSVDNWEEIWSIETLEEFVKFLNNVNHTSEEAGLIFDALDEEALGSLYFFDNQLWKAIAEFYCQYSYGSFSFAYCDVIANRLRSIFDLGKPGTQALAVLAAANLGSSHNRWYVMSIVLKMVGPNICDTLARRIAIEIKVSDVQGYFIDCARGIGEELSAYHPRIQRVLEEYTNQLSADTRV